MTQFVIVIDAPIVNVALPSIGQALHFARRDLSWVVNAYALAFGGFLLLGGRMADLLGRRRMFMVALVVFSLASLAGGMAQSEGWLIATRAAQWPRSRDRLAGRAVDHHHRLCRGRGAQPRARDLGSRRGRRGGPPGCCSAARLASRRRPASGEDRCGAQHQVSLPRIRGRPNLVLAGSGRVVVAAGAELPPLGRVIVAVCPDLSPLGRVVVAAGADLPPLGGVEGLRVGVFACRFRGD